MRWELLLFALGAFLGGVVEGRTRQGMFLFLPLNLTLCGMTMVTYAATDIASDALLLIACGLAASYFASDGYLRGRLWAELGLRRAIFRSNDGAEPPTSN